MIHVVVMKSLTGLPLLIHIELLWRGRSRSFKTWGVGFRVEKGCVPTPQPWVEVYRCSGGRIFLRNVWKFCAEDGCSTLAGNNGRQHTTDGNVDAAVRTWNLPRPPCSLQLTLKCFHLSANICTAIRRYPVSTRITCREVGSAPYCTICSVDRNRILIGCVRIHGLIL
jgi:hypothetical protein